MYSCCWTQLWMTTELTTRSLKPSISFKGQLTGLCERWITHHYHKISSLISFNNTSFNTPLWIFEFFAPTVNSPFSIFGLISEIHRGEEGESNGTDTKLQSAGHTAWLPCPNRHLWSCRGLGCPGSPRHHQFKIYWAPEFKVSQNTDMGKTPKGHESHPRLSVAGTGAQ